MQNGEHDTETYYMISVERHVIVYIQDENDGSYTIVGQSRTYSGLRVGVRCIVSTFG